MPAISSIPSIKSILKRIRAEFRYRLPLDRHKWVGSYRLQRMARQIAEHSSKSNEQAPVVFFNASTAINRMSLNAAFSLLTAWSLRLTGVPVVHFVCRRGMTHCVLGTNRDAYFKSPPCEVCIAHSNLLYSHSPVRGFSYQPNSNLQDELQGLDLSQLTDFKWGTIPYGEIVLPSLRWTLRRHHLPDDEKTRYLMRDYILSAHHVALEFKTLIDEVNPKIAILFNGMFYPEAAARWVARQHGVRVITHEVGYRPFSAFFTEGEATAYPLQIPDDFELDEEQNTCLDNFLQDRFEGNFSMAGIRFWPEMRGLSEAFLERASQFKQIVPVFSNVVFDTSQVHANTVFPDMFAWLEIVLQIINENPETLFILRAHPDEIRPGKASQESVQDWADWKGLHQLPNLIFVKPDEYISSYELIDRSKFVMVYNSSIGLEAAVMGKTVLSGGNARYTRYPIVYFPETPQEYLQQANVMLQADSIEIPAQFIKNARRFLYYQFFRASLPFDKFLEKTAMAGFVRLSNFSWDQLLPENSSSLQVIHAGLFQGAPFFRQNEKS